MNINKILNAINFPQWIAAIFMLIFGGRCAQLGWGGDDLGFCAIILIPIGLWFLFSRQHILHEMKNAFLGISDDE
jgi:hypothetical protein